MITIIIAWLVNDITLLAGGVIGYYLGQKKKSEQPKIETVFVEPEKKSESGGVKPYTTAEKKALGKTSAEGRMKDLLE